jgi:hypothetical protein
MTERTLTARELNRAVLARQHLLRRSTASLPVTTERVAGIQAQYAPSIYIGLWSRAEGVTVDGVTRALVRRSLVQATSLRGTIHVLSRRDHWPFVVASRTRMRAIWLRSRPGLDEGRMREAADLLRPRLAEGPVGRREMEDLIGRDRAQGVGFWVDMVRTPPAGTWGRRRADLYGDAAAWVGPPDDDLDADAAVAHLVRRHLAAFGPAAAADVADWAGLTIGAVTPALDAMDLRRFRDEAGRVLLDLPRAPLPDAGTPAPARLLPTWDAALLVHARRAGILSEEHRPRIFSTRTPFSFPTFLVDGTVAGTWRLDDGRVELSPFGTLAAADRRDLEEEGARLAAFAAGDPP